MTHALFVALASHPQCNRPGISSKSALNAPSLRLSAPTIGTHTSLQDLRRTVGASEIPIAPADRGAHLTRFPSLAAFERRPTGHGTCCQLGEWGRHPKPVTAPDSCTAAFCVQLADTWCRVGWSCRLVNCQAQPIQKVFSILAEPPMFGAWNQNRRNRAEPFD